MNCKKCKEEIMGKEALINGEIYCVFCFNQTKQRPHRKSVREFWVKAREKRLTS